jgi:drug/metabolite transporter (DMT)-like permease
MTKPKGGAQSAGGAPALPATGYLLLAGLTLFWGLNFPAMKIVLGEIPVWPFRAICLIVSGLALLALARLGGQQLRVPTAEIWPLLICTLLYTAGWHIFSAYGVSLIEAGRAAIIAFTMPVWAALLGVVVLDERITASKLLGLVLGVAGLAVLIGPDLSALGTAPLGGLFMLIAAIGWASSTVAIKRFSWTISPLVLAGWLLFLGGIPLTLGAVLFTAIPDPAAISGQAYVALAYVVVFPMAFCQWSWFKLVRIFPALIASIGTLAVPVAGVLASGLILGEAIGLRELAALGLVCTALVVVLVIPALNLRRRGAPPAGGPG